MRLRHLQRGKNGFSIGIINKVEVKDKETDNEEVSESYYEEKIKQ